MFKANNIVSTIALAIIALAITNNAQAAPTPTIPSGSTGGGSSSGRPETSTTTYTSHSSNGFHGSVVGRTTDEWEHFVKWTNEDGTVNESSHIHPQEAEADMDLNLYNDGSFTYGGEQAYAKPIGSEFRVYREEGRNENVDGVEFQASGRITFSLTNNYDEIANWNAPPSTYYNYNFDGISINGGISIVHGQEYEKPQNEGDDWIRIDTDRIQAEMEFEIEYGRINRVGLSIGDGWDDDVNEMIVEVDIWATYTGPNVEAFMSAIQVVHAPEPATMSLLALGGLAMLRRRRR